MSGGILGIAILAVGIRHTKGFFSPPATGEALGTTLAAAEGAASIRIETVGESQLEGNEDVGVSWPGEIISLGDIEVQPQREGVIVEWKTNIGQKVFSGQVLGRLSAPPKAPELVKMLAEQAESLAKAKGQSQATGDFVKKNIEQLHTLRDALQKNIAAVGSTLDGSAGTKNNTVQPSRPALEQLQSVVTAKRQQARKTIEQILHAHIRQITYTVNPQQYSRGSLRYEFGGLDNNTRQNYETLAYALASELKDSDAFPMTTAQKYAQAAVNLMNATADTASLPQDLERLQKMANDDQADMLGAQNDYEEARSELAMREVEYALTHLEQEKDYAEQVKEINEQIAMLERERQMALVEVQAAQAAYGTVVGSFTGGLNIVAPAAGTISAIYKKNGDFVEPGMSVAAINTNDTSQRFVRFRIPSNLAVPEPGARLTMLRSGYPRDGKIVQLIGTGTALDGNGAFVADAEFIDPVDWPVHITVRVMPPPGSMAATLVPFAAVWWDDSAQANVWLVTEEEKIRPQPVKTGKVLGDKIEVIEGLQPGNRYVAKVTDGLVPGMALKEIQPEDGQQAAGQKEATGGSGDLMKGMIMDN